MIRIDLLWTAFVVSVLANIALAYACILNSSERSYLRSDSRIISRSIEIYAGDTRQSIRDAMTNRYPVVAQGPGMRCVNLQFESESFGSIPVFCFDGDERLIYKGSS